MCAYPHRYISIHAAREGGDSDSCNSSIITGISIHAAREGGDVFSRLVPILLSISIHAAREGGDQDGHSVAATVQQFQSTPPVKAATRYFLFVY